MNAKEKTVGSVVQKGKGIRTNRANGFVVSLADTPGLLPPPDRLWTYDNGRIVNKKSGHGKSNGIVRQ